MSSFSTTRQSLWATITTSANSISSIIGTIGDAADIANGFVQRHKVLQQETGKDQLAVALLESKVETRTAAANALKSLAKIENLEDAEAALRGMDEIINKYQLK